MLVELEDWATDWFGAAIARTPTTSHVLVVSKEVIFGQDFTLQNEHHYVLLANIDYQRSTRHLNSTYFEASRSMVLGSEKLGHRQLEAFE